MTPTVEQTQTPNPVPPIMETAPGSPITAPDVWYGSPATLHFDPNNPRINGLMEPNEVTSYSKKTARKGFDPAQLPYLHDIRELAISIAAGNQAGLMVSPLVCTTATDGTITVISGNRRLAASRMIQQGFTTPDGRNIKRPDWVVCYMMADGQGGAGDVNALAVMLNSSDQMTSAQYYAYVKKVTDAMLKAGKGREDIISTLVAHTGKSSQWAVAMLTIYEAPDKVGQLVLKGIMGMKTARDLSSQPERVIGHVLSQGGFDDPEQWGWGAVNDKIRAAHVELGTEAYRPYDDTELGVALGVGEDNDTISDGDVDGGGAGDPGTDSNPGVGGGATKSTRKAAGTATAQDAPTPQPRKRVGKTGEARAPKSLAPKLTVKEIVSTLREQAGYEETKGKVKDEDMLDVLTAVRLWVEGEIKFQGMTLRIGRVIKKGKGGGTVTPEAA